MDAMGVDVQVLSATPQTYSLQPGRFAWCRDGAIQNDQIAKLGKAEPQRFMGIATLPMQAPDKAGDELKRAMTKLACAEQCLRPTS
jgi:aminocarboxymuconate-semialdehyde decarboxylase